MKNLRMNAYYYSFKETGCHPIDKILSAVATAGKRAHNTEDWHDEIINYIQKCANEAAKLYKERMGF